MLACLACMQMFVNACLCTLVGKWPAHSSKGLHFWNLCVACETHCASRVAHVWPRCEGNCTYHPCHCHVRCQIPRSSKPECIPTGRSACVCAHKACYVDVMLHVMMACVPRACLMGCGRSCLRQVLVPHVSTAMYQVSLAWFFSKKALAAACVLLLLQHMCCMPLLAASLASCCTSCCWLSRVLHGHLCLTWPAGRGSL
jgi:hypothetical protein